MRRNAHSRDEVLDSIRTLAKDLGRTPTVEDFRERSDVTTRSLYLHFPRWRDALSAAGIDLPARFQSFTKPDLLREWGTVARRHSLLPTRLVYAREGRLPISAFDRLLGRWSGVPAKFRDFAAGNPDWAEVLALIPANKPVRRKSSTRNKSCPPIVSPPGPTCGNPLNFRALCNEPVNELGVILLFGSLATDLGFMVESIQGGFPDCEARHRVEPRSPGAASASNSNSRAGPSSPTATTQTAATSSSAGATTGPTHPHLQVIELSTVVRQLACARAQASTPLP